MAKTKLSAETMEAIPRLLQTMTIRGVGEHLGIPGSTVNSVVRRLKCHNPRADLKRPWTDADMALLTRLVSTHSVAQMAGFLKRSKVSVSSKMREERIRAFEGSYSLTEAVLKTGYNKDQLRRARIGLNQRWTKIPYGAFGRLQISENQVEAMCQWLKDEQRSKHRFWPFMFCLDRSECWLWRSTKTICIEGKVYSPAQAAYRTLIGDPKDRKVYQECHEKVRVGQTGSGTFPCVNPNHLFLGIQGGFSTTEALAVRSLEREYRAATDPAERERLYRIIYRDPRIAAAIGILPKMYSGVA